MQLFLDLSSVILDEACGHASRPGKLGPTPKIVTIKGTDGQYLSGMPSRIVSRRDSASVPEPSAGRRVPRLRSSLHRFPSKSWGLSAMLTHAEIGFCLWYYGLGATDWQRKRAQIQHGGFPRGLRTPSEKCRGCRKAPCTRAGFRRRRPHPDSRRKRLKRYGICHSGSPPGHPPCDTD